MLGLTSTLNYRYTAPTTMEQQIQQPETTAFSQQTSYQQPLKAKNSGAKWLIIFILLLVLGGAGIYFFSKSANEPIATPTPSFGVVPIDTPSATSTPLSTLVAIDRDEVTIEILNGTGITGEAKLLSDRLEKLGYSEITAANADTTDNTATTVTFSKDLSQAIQDEIKKELESFYKEVNVKTSTTQKSDVVIITGLRSGQTSKATSSATPKATSSATPKPSTSPIPSGPASITN